MAEQFTYFIGKEKRATSDYSISFFNLFIASYTYHMKLPFGFAEQNNETHTVF